MEKLPVDFYLTGGTALSRAYLCHRYSDDLDFFVNQNTGFGKQVELIIESLRSENIKIEIAVTGDSFARVLVYHREDVLKIDFVNDIPYRSGIPVSTGLYSRTDTIRNILSNKLTALSRHATKDVADLLYIALNYSFNWMEIFREASEKDLWINAIEASKILDSFPVDKLDEIIWINEKPDYKLFEKQLQTLIRDIIIGHPNSLVNNDICKA